MLSRVADAVYWMERYIERAENIARFIDVNLNLTLDTPHDSEKQWAPLAKTTGDYALFESCYSQATEESVTEFLVFDEGNPNSVLNCLRKARENARSVREVITSEMWHEINTAYLFVQKTARDRVFHPSPYQFYNRVKRQCQLFTGIAHATMSHNAAWHFGRLGYLLERADKTSRILDMKYFIILPSADYVGTPYDNIQWGSLLKSTSGLEMYQKIWHQIYHTHVLDFLILNSDFPRAIHYCLTEAQKSLHCISGTPLGNFRSAPEKLLGHLCAKLEQLKPEDIINHGLHEFLEGVQGQLTEIDTGIFNTFFALHPVELAS